MPPIWSRLLTLLPSFSMWVYVCFCLVLPVYLLSGLPVACLSLACLRNRDTVKFLMLCKAHWDNVRCAISIVRTTSSSSSSSIIIIIIIRASHRSIQDVQDVLPRICSKTSHPKWQANYQRRHFRSREEFSSAWRYMEGSCFVPQSCPNGADQEERGLWVWDCRSYEHHMYLTV